ncbi:hypothetical protein [Pseudomonas sp. JUb42]|uniref:hypothetical protein n=1 Tax=Pseudomonas sp. JUb42 TaxID=2940611 RepID=UPI00216983C4|nr:hypothetical protein [Pseudomonas sp. JUb42]
MRAMDALTQNLIDSLTQILSKESTEVSLATLQICAPVLIEHLQVVKHSAVDRRDVESQLRKALDNWLKEHPQPDMARQSLQELLEQELLGKPTSMGEESA